MILLEPSKKSTEYRLVLQHALTYDIELHRVDQLDLWKYKEELLSGALPVGCIQYHREAMDVVGMKEPEDFSYPASLEQFLHRRVQKIEVSKVFGRWFVKPLETKAFTGFVVDTTKNPNYLTPYEQIQLNELLTLPQDTVVWLSDPVEWLSEVRYYIIEGVICGSGRYDDATDSAPLPDDHVVEQMVQQMKNTLAAFVIDVGVLSTGETALVECNDAWAVGYYKGSLSPAKYIEMLQIRWNQLLKEMNNEKELGV